MRQFYSRIFTVMTIARNIRGVNFLKENPMTVKASIKETTGAAEEELGEALGDSKMADKGRQMRNEGRIENGKTPKTTVPGTQKEKHHMGS